MTSRAQAHRNGNAERQDDRIIQVPNQRNETPGSNRLVIEQEQRLSLRRLWQARGHPRIARSEPKGHNVTFELGGPQLELCENFHFIPQKRVFSVWN